MRSIKVKSYPFKEYDSPEAAIVATINYSQKLLDEKDVKKLKGSKIKDSCWTDKDFAILFSNNLWLHIYIENHSVCWNLGEKLKRNLLPCDQKIGSLAITLDWGYENALEIFDRSNLLSERIGAEFESIVVADYGFLHYTKGHDILIFCPIKRIDNGEDMLYVYEDS